MKPSESSVKETILAIANYIAENSSHTYPEDFIPSALSKAEITLSTLVVRNPNEGGRIKGIYGTCGSCDIPNRLYEAGHDNRVIEYSNLECFECLVSSVCFRIQEIDFDGIRITYKWVSFVQRTVADFLKPLLPDTTEMRLSCPMCNQIFLTPEESRKWSTTLALNEYGGEVEVHNECSFDCHESHGCGKTFATNVRNPNELGVRRNTIERNHICEPCLEVLLDCGDARSCEQCCKYYYRNSMVYDEHTDSEYCSSCWRQMWQRCDDCEAEFQPSRGNHQCHRGIHNYGHKPKPIFYGFDSYYFGIELEVEQCDDEYGLSGGVEIVENTLAERAYMKEDGSLENGFEIVTHPHSLEEFQSELDWRFLAKLRDYGFRSWDTSSCGLHVHISRQAFTDENHLVRFMKLIYDNKGAVQNIAGRASDYARFTDQKQVFRKVKYGIDSDGHCSAVNTENESTVEVRVFRGSLNKTRVLSAIEFCHAAVEYTRKMKVVPKDRPFAWTKFLSFIVNESVRIPNRYSHLAEITDSAFNTYRLTPTREEN